MNNVDKSDNKNTANISSSPRNIFKPKGSKFGLGSLLTSCFLCLFASVFLAVSSGFLTTASQLISDIFNSTNTNPPVGQIEVVPPFDLIEDDPISENTGDQNPYEQTVLKESENDKDVAKPDPVFARPDSMKGVWVVPGTDYFTSNDDRGEDVAAQIDSLLSQVSEWDFNTLILPLWKSEKVANKTVETPLFANSWGYDCMVINNADGTPFDVLKYISEKAREKNLYIYAVFDCKMNANENGESLDPAIIGEKQKIIGLLSDVLNSYSFDGFLLDGIGYSKETKPDYNNYMNTNPGAGYEDFIYSCVDKVTKNIVNLIKNKDNNLYAGLLVEPDLARDLPAGSATIGEKYFDTTHAIKNKLFDFIMIENYQSTLDKTASFNTILNWWTKLASENEVPLYLSHASNKSHQNDGFRSPDQLTKQLISCQDSAAWKGSVFNSYTALKKDASGSTGAVLSYFKNEIKKDLIFKDLVIVNPSKQEITTEEPRYNLRGNADTNFPITFNGEEIKLTESGDFSFDVNLAIGKNAYEFKHKGETVSLVINYRFVVMKSMTPLKNQTVDGGARLAVSAIARKNSSVTAKLGNTGITLKQQDSSDDENNFNEGSEFKRYYGEFSLPEGNVDGTKSLGVITVSASCQGVTNSQTGGSVTLRKTEVVIIDPIDVEEAPKPPAPGKDEPTGFLKHGGKTASGRIVEVIDEYAQTFDGSTADDISRPTNAYLPRGTQDVISSTSNSYYKLGYGNRTYKSHVKEVASNGTLYANGLQARFVGTSSTTTFMRIGTSWKVPYTVKMYPQSYKSDNAITGFTATYIDFTFAYTTSVSGEFKMAGNPLFSKAEWIKTSKGIYTLRLHFKTAGGFHGYSAVWNDKTGNLELTFRAPTNTIKGKRIVIDAGHGGKDSGAVGSSNSSLYYEKDANLGYAKVLKSELEKLGAFVTLTRTTDATLDYHERTVKARNNGTDLFISLHQDSASSSDARGYSIYYFNEYSMNAAKTVNSRLYPIYKEQANYDNKRGYLKRNFNVMRIHDCPAILLECAFISNAKDLALIKSEKYKKAMMSGVAKGLSDYFSSLPTIAKTAPANAPLAPADKVAQELLSTTALAVVDNKKKSLF